MNRRDLIASASAGVALSVIGVETAASAKVCRQLDPHPVCALPFVRDTSWAERAAGLPARLFWSVETTGDHLADERLGAAYARAAMDYVNAHHSPNLLSWCVSDMGRLQRSFSGIELVFLRTFAAYGASSHWILQRAEEDPSLMRGAEA